MSTVIQFWSEHQALVVAVGLYTLTGVLNLLLRFKTVEQWVEFGEKYPRLQNIIRVLRAIGLDPVKLVKSILDFFFKKAEDTKKDRPDVIQKDADAKENDNG